MVGSHQNSIPYTEFQIYPEGYIQTSNYTAHLTNDPALLTTPMDLKNIRDLDDNYFGLDTTTKTISVYNDDLDIRKPLFYVVLTNNVDEAVLWTYFNVTLENLPFNQAPTFTKEILSVFYVE